MFDKILLPLAIGLFGSILASLALPPWQRLAAEWWEPTWVVERVDSPPRLFEVELRARIRAERPGLIVHLPREPATPAAVSLQIGAWSGLAERCARLQGRSLRLLSGWSPDGDLTPPCPISEWRANEVLHLKVALAPESDAESASVTIVAQEAFRPATLSLERPTAARPWAYRLASYGVPAMLLFSVLAGTVRLTRSGSAHLERAELLEDFVTSDANESGNFRQYVLEKVVNGTEAAKRYFDHVFDRRKTVHDAARTLRADGALMAHWDRTNPQQLDDVWDRSFRGSAAVTFKSEPMRSAYPTLELMRSPIRKEFVQFAKNELLARSEETVSPQATPPDEADG